MADPILIVDDDRDLLRGLAIRLRAEGYRVMTAPNAGAVITAAVGAPFFLLLLRRQKRIAFW